MRRSHVNASLNYLIEQSTLCVCKDGENLFYLLDSEIQDCVNKIFKNRKQPENIIETIRARALKKMKRAKHTLP